MYYRIQAPDSPHLAFLQDVIHQEELDDKILTIDPNKRYLIIDVSEEQLKQLPSKNLDIQKC